jgi:uncharacterized protein YegL
VSNFILNSTPVPERQEVSTYLRDPARPQGRDLLQLQRFSELARAISLQPGKSIEENIAEGTAFVPTRRQRIEIPTGFGNEDAERITIVLYDISGSMAGEPARFQTGLVRAFTAQALSDVSPSGRHRHRVVLIPFDDKVGERFPVTNNDEALHVLRDLKIERAEGGTEIQGALLQGLALIADAQLLDPSKPLASANIVLMTDGQAPVNLDEIVRARNKIDGRTPVQIMFAAIGSTNAELAKLAEETSKRGSITGYYREFTSQTMTDYFKEADGPVKAGAPGQIYTEKHASAVPPSFKTNLFMAANWARDFLENAKNAERSDPPEMHLQLFEKTRWSGIPTIDRPLADQLNGVRTFGYGKVFNKFLPLLRPIVHDLMTNFKTLAKHDFNELSNEEQEVLRHLMRYAAGLEGVSGNEK